MNKLTNRHRQKNAKSISNTDGDENTQDYYTLDRLFLTEYIERRNNQKQT